MQRWHSKVFSCLKDARRPYYNHHVQGWNYTNRKSEWCQIVPLAFGKDLLRAKEWWQSLTVPWRNKCLNRPCEDLLEALLRKRRNSCPWLKHCKHIFVKTYKDGHADSQNSHMLKLSLVYRFHRVNLFWKGGIRQNDHWGEASKGHTFITVMDRVYDTSNMFLFVCNYLDLLKPNLIKWN